MKFNSVDIFEESTIFDLPSAITRLMESVQQSRYFVCNYSPSRKQRPQPEAGRVRGISEEVYRSQYTKLSEM